MRTRAALASALLGLSGERSHAQTPDAAVSGKTARSLNADVRAYWRGCPGKAVAVSVQPMPLNPAGVTRIVSLAASSCFGQPGQDACLVAEGARGWERELPGPGTTPPAVTGISQAPSCS